jgi:hypothetical protein
MKKPGRNPALAKRVSKLSFCRQALGIVRQCVQAIDDAGPFGGVALARRGRFVPGFGPLDPIKRLTDVGTGAFLDANRR